MLTYQLADLMSMNASQQIVTNSKFSFMVDERLFGKSTLKIGLKKDNSFAAQRSCSPSRSRYRISRTFLGIRPEAGHILSYRECCARQTGMHTRLWKHFLFCRDGIERKKEIYIHLVLALLRPVGNALCDPLATPCLQY
jgi:hypothetical protein